MKKYVIAGKILDNKNELSALKLIDIDDNSTYIMNINDVKHKISMNNIEIINVTLDNKGELQYKINIDSIEDVTTKQTYSNMFFDSKQLKKSFDIVTKYQRRKQFDEIINWIDNGKPGKILGLYGLRRTGKTVLLLQVCEYIARNNEVLYCKVDSTIDQKQFMLDINRLSSSNKYKLIVIDEITSLKELLICGNTLSDTCSMLGQKIIITGTQSLMLKFSKHDILYDRIDLIDTTYISFSEFNKLFRSDINTYIKWGGVLSSTREITKENYIDYIRTAIIDNLQHSFECCSSSGVYYPAIYNMYEDNTLYSVIQRFINRLGKKEIIKYVNKQFKDTNFGSSMELLRKKIDINDPLQYVDDIQPGLQYEQAMETISIVKNKIGDKRVTDEIINDIEGRLLEQVIRLNLMNKYKEQDKYKVISFRTNSGKEIDIVVINPYNNISLIEVKHSNKEDVINQCKWLVDSELNNNILDVFGETSNIVSRYVIYNGDTHEVKLSGYNIKYYNASEFLLNV